MRAGTTIPFLFLFACSSDPTPTGPTDSGFESSADSASDAGNDSYQPPKDSGPVKCNTPNDCPDPMEMVCDPMSSTCVFDECGPTSGKSCPMGQVCVFQVSGTNIGACYPQCAPFAQDGGGCTPAQECVIGKFDGTVGYCKRNGVGATGSSCLPSSVETGCVPGDVCVLDPQMRFCREQCDFWNGQHDCSSLACTPPGVCTGETPDPAPVGGTCTTPPGTLCGASGKKLLGWCVGMAPVKCLAWCRTQFNDCPVNQTCMPTNIPSIGYCQ